MNIAIIASEIDISKSLVHRVKLSAQTKEFAKLDHGVMLLSQTSDENFPKIFKQKRTKGIFQRFPSFFWNEKLGAFLRPIKLIKTEMMIKNFIKDNKNKIDVIYQRGHAVSFAGTYAKKKLGIPLVIEYNGDLATEYKNAYFFAKCIPFFETLTKYLFKRLFSSADAIICGTKLLAEDVCKLGIDKNKVKVVYNGAEIEKFRKVKKQEIKKIREKLNLQNKKIVTHISSFMPWHGHRTVLAAAEKVKNKDIALLFVGDGPTRKALEKQVSEKRYNCSIHFIGKIQPEKIPAVLAASSVLLMVWDRENYPEPKATPTKLFEYMASGKPIIVSSFYTEINNILKHKKSGFIIDTENPKIFAKNIVELASNKKLSAGIGKESGKISIDYSWSKNAAAYVEVFREVV